MHFRLHYQKTAAVVWTLILPSFLAVGLLALLMEIFPRLTENDTVFLLFTYGLVGVGIICTLVFYKTQAIKECDIYLESEGINIQIRGFSLLYPARQFIQWSNIAKISFEDINGKYAVVRTKVPAKSINLVKDLFIYPSKADTTDEEYRRFEEALSAMTAAYKLSQEPFIDSNSI